MLTPAIRATSALPLLVTRIRADHQHRTVAADDLALLAHGLDRRPYLHVPLLVASGAAALAAVAAAATTSRKMRAARSAPARARRVILANRRPRAPRPPPAWSRDARG